MDGGRMRVEQKYKFVVIMFLSLLIGISVGLVISFFHQAVNWVIDNKSEFIYLYWPWNDMLWVPYILTSAFMIFLSVRLVRYLAPETRGSGIQEIEGVVSNQRSMHEVRVILVKFFGGVLSLGGNMAMGKEGPSVQIGGAFGQLASHFFTLDKEDLHILIVAGAGAGLATAFNAPLAGILFVFEEMRKSIKYTYISLQSVVLSVVASIVTLRIVFGNSISIPIDTLTAPQAYDMWIFAVLGLFFGVLGFIFNKYLLAFVNRISGLDGWKFNVLILLIGALIGFLFYIFPDSVGEGYHIIHQAVHENLSVDFLLILFAIRFFTTMLSYGTGAPGGIFAPMMALGTLFGVAFGLLVKLYLPEVNIDPIVFAVVGMGALFSATVRAPLTGIVLVAEMTVSFNLLLPQLVTALVATIVVNSMGGRAIYTILLENAFKVSKFGNKHH